MYKGPPHIAIVVNSFPTISQTFIVNQINSLIDSGYTVNLFSYKKEKATIIHESLKKHNLLGAVHYFIKPPDSKIRRLLVFFKWTFQNFSKINWRLFFRTLNVFKYGKDAYTLKLFFEAQWFLMPHKIDLIHAHFGMVGNRIAYLKGICIIPKSIKLITTFHGYDLEPKKLGLYKKVYANLFKYADAFTVNTVYLEGLLKKVNIYNKPHYILPVGLDTHFFKRTDIKLESDFFDLVFCGRLKNLKGPDIAINIVNKLHVLGSKKVRLHLIGDGSLRELLRKQVKNLRLEDFVIFYGALSQEDIKDRFEQSDVFIMPGRVELKTGLTETQGLVIQEAQAMELPVVISNLGGMKYGVLPNESGFVIAENDVDGYVEAIQKLITDSELKLKMGEIGRAFVIRNYSNEVLSRDLLRIYSGF